MIWPGVPLRRNRLQPSNTNPELQSFNFPAFSIKVRDMDSVTLYFALLLAGSVLVGTEIFVPGGILGAMGGLVWLTAAIIGWSRFSEPWNLISVISILFIALLTFVLWIRFFPKSSVGKSLSLDENSGSYKAHKTTAFPVGTVGQAFSTLRPSGIALFDGRRVDVVADGEWIEEGTPVKISSTSGGHISVEKA